MGLRHQQTSQRVHQVRAILAASCGSNSSLRFTDASGDDVAFSVPEQGQRGLEAGGVCYAILLGKRMNNQWTWGTLPFVGHKHMRQLRGLTLRSKVWLSFLVSPCGAKVEVSINGADAKHVRRNLMPQRVAGQNFLRVSTKGLPTIMTKVGTTSAQWGHIESMS